MATMILAMWIQEADTAGSWHLMTIFIGVIAVVVVLMAAVLIGVAVAALKTVKELGVLAQELKGKCLPLIEEVTGITQTGHKVLREAAPKVKLIGDHLAQTSETIMQTSKVARGVVEGFGATSTDVNFRAQRQVARVDGMVSAALTTTSEVVETISNGIRVPAQKIAAMVTEARFAGEGLLAKVKSMVDRKPFRNGY